MWRRYAFFLFTFENRRRKNEDENVTRKNQALVRQYFKATGNRKALEAFDKDCPRTENTISSRKKLASLTCVDKSNKCILDKLVGDVVLAKQRNQGG